MNSFITLKWFLLIIFFLGVCLPENYAQLEDNTLQPEVTISQGTLIGTTLITRLGRNVSSFYGIPYAQPPIGDLRFASPVKASGWEGTLNASSEMSMCPQPILDSIEGDEDCLYLRVHTPQLPQNVTSLLLPVMVYIHGGGFSSESPAGSGPEFLLDADVVLVTLNYRLSVLGFLSTGDEVASGNWGLKDQVLALEWVRDNIRFFGGDPEQVTLFGESAGAGSVHLLTFSDLTIGLFHRYITQSGSIFGIMSHRPRVTASTVAFQFGEYIGCFNETSEGLISCLRTVNYVYIVSKALEFINLGTIIGMAWTPTDELDIEGALLTDTPRNLLAAGKIRDLPWMSGVVRDEGLLTTNIYYVDEVSFNDLLQDFETNLPSLLNMRYESEMIQTWMEAIMPYYFNGYTSWNTTMMIKNLTTVVTDSQFYFPSRKVFLKQYAVAINPQYFYTFNYRGTWSFSYEATGNLDDYGVRHADDLIYLFPKDALFEAFNETMSEKDFEMVNTMVQLWTSFATNGTPTASALGDGVTWEPYSSEDKYLRIGKSSETSLEIQTSFFPEQIQFWANLDALLDVETESSFGTATSSANLLILTFLAMISCLKFFIPAIY